MRNRVGRTKLPLAARGENRSNAVIPDGARCAPIRNLEIVLLIPLEIPGSPLRGAPE
jgi:hypothetical protein